MILILQSFLIAGCGFFITRCDLVPGHALVGLVFMGLGVICFVLGVFTSFPGFKDRHEID